MKPSIRAEQAVLGSLLLEPAMLRHVDGWLLPIHFHRPYHRAVYATMLRLVDHGRTPTADAVRAALPDCDELHPGTARDATRLAELMEAVPTPERVETYAAMVYDAAVHRHVGDVGRHLDHVAQAGSVEDVLAELAGTRAALAWWRRGEDDVPPVVARALDPEAPVSRIARGLPIVDRDPEPTAAERSRSAAEPADSLGSPACTEAASSTPARGRTQHAADDPRAAAEQRLLASIGTYPEQLAGLACELRPEHLAPGWRREVYATALELYADDDPVDELTVTWAAQRRGLTAEVDPETLLDSLRGGAMDASAAAAAIRDQSVRQATRELAADLQAQASDPTITPDVLLAAVDARLAEVQARHAPAERAEVDREPERIGAWVEEQTCDRGEGGTAEAVAQDRDRRATAVEEASREEATQAADRGDELAVRRAQRDADREQVTADRTAAATTDEPPRPQETDRARAARRLGDNRSDRRPYRERARSRELDDEHELVR